MRLQLMACFQLGPKETHLLRHFNMKMKNMCKMTAFTVTN